MKTLKALLFLLSAIPVIAQQLSSEVLIKTSCFKSAAIKPTSEFHLNDKVTEGSGLISWNGQIWTHNDSGLPEIFSLDPKTGAILKVFNLPVKNIDWEEISQDKNFIYIGNFGNNSNERSPLQIYRVKKEALLQDKVELDSISFVWPAVTDKGKSHKTNFDCEAMIVMHDSVFLFTKEWKPRPCSRIFKIPATPGNHTAHYVATIKTRLLITGANYSEEKKRIVLCGYSWLLKPRLLVLSVPESGNLAAIKEGKKIRVRKQFKQTEGITNFEGDDYFLIGEASKFMLYSSKQTLYRLTIK